MPNNLKYSKKHPKIFQYKNKSGLFWGYRTTYYDNFNERHESQKRGFKTENEAYKAYLNTESDIASQNTNLVKDKNITFKQLGEMFLESRLPYLKKTTAQNYKLNINKIISLVGDIKIQKMTPMIYQKKVINYYVDQGLMKNTILNVHNRMMMLMNIAVDNDIILKNNLNRVVIPDTGKIEKRIMSVDELKKFNKQLEKEPFLTQILFYTLEQTGLRQGELLGLKWKNIDIDNNKLHIELTRDYLGSRTPKTKGSIRDVQISQSLSDMYKKYKIECAKLFLKNKLSFNDDNFAIISEYLNPLVNTGISLRLRNTLRRAGLEYLIGHFTAHSFRHMYASYLLNNGVEVSSVSAALGHSNPNMTLSIYTEQTPDKNDNLADKFNDLW